MMKEDEGKPGQWGQKLIVLTKKKAWEEASLPLG